MKSDRKSTGNYKRIEIMFQVKLSLVILRNICGKSSCFGLEVFVTFYHQCHLVQQIIEAVDLYDDSIKVQ